MEDKDYSVWQKIKTIVHNENERPFFHQREIWFCSLGENVGYEQDGRRENFLRPVIILRKFNNDICLIIPLTRTAKGGIHYFNFSYQSGITSTAILSQLRLIDAKRLQYKSGDINKQDFKLLKEKLKLLIA